MSTIRETMETTFSAAAFAERNLAPEAEQLMKELRPDVEKRNTATKKVAQRPRPTIQVK